MTLTTLPEWAALGPVFALVATALLVLLVNTVAPDSDHGGLFATLTTGGGLAGLGITVWYLLGDTGQPDGGGPIVLFDGNLEQPAPVPHQQHRREQHPSCKHVLDHRGRHLQG